MDEYDARSSDCPTREVQRCLECIEYRRSDALYAEDGVFMPPYSPSAVGSEALRKAYDAVFRAITLNVKFTIAEIVELAPEWAFARTNSAGTTLDHATGNKSAEANQELFIFRKDRDGSWKIARYSFSSTNPPRH